MEFHTLPKLKAINWIDLHFSIFSFPYLHSLFFCIDWGLIEPRRKKTGLLHMRKQTQISFAVTAKVISAFVFATRIVQSIYFLNPKIQASIHLLGLYSPVFVGPGPEDRFSHNEAQFQLFLSLPRIDSQCNYKTSYIICYTS